VAASCGFSVSALAKKSGLDPTTFNRSKRLSNYGKERWPSTESLNKILHYLGMSMSDFVNNYLGEDEKSAANQRFIPLFKFQDLELNKFVDNKGNLNGKFEDEIVFPAHCANLYAVEIMDNNLNPIYRCGDRLIVCAQCPIRRGDRLVMKTSRGIMACELVNQSANRMECKNLANQHILILSVAEIDWMARIFWTEYGL
jgi:phage repressor protein C with HTH and peptisase S24 domain